MVGIDSALVVELARHIVGVSISRIIDVFAAALLVLAILRDTRDDILSVIVAPYRCKRGITAFISLIIGRSIVNTIFSTEIKPFEQWRKIDIKACIELELTAHKLAVAGCVCICHRIGGILLRTTEEEFAILNVATVEHRVQ